jgi:putative Holliday junction resolvase
MQPKDYIGIDVGQARTGIARASSVARLPEPLKTVPSDKLLEELESIIAKTEVAGIVVGLPRSLSGDDTAQTQWVRSWVAQAKARLSVPFYLQDEALTTVAAATDGDKSNDLDAKAAAIILKDFLDINESERVRA